MQIIKILALAFYILFCVNNTYTQNSNRKFKKERLERFLAHKEKQTAASFAIEELKQVEVLQSIDDISLQVELPELKREFRGAWIATVANINWPSKRNLSTEEQKKEAIALLDLLHDANFNAVIFQVRPSADALYKSNYEPWSYFLTGETGKSPNPYYDPLDFWISEAHKRGMELHVWLNPYRAHHSSGGTVGKEAMVNKMPENILRLKNGMYWFDPADIRTQNHVSNVVMDIVKRYDIDGVHFDDYFYPYKSYNGGGDFPDHKTWNIYRENGGKLNRADWRRQHVNQIVKRIYQEIKAEKPHVKFGISPFGIWRPGYPEGITGMSQYDELYADAKLWLNNGWIDYFAPQLYWPMNSKGQNFSKLLNWWKSENTHNRHLWPGVNTVEVKAINRAEEICKQIEESCAQLQNSKGVIHWSIAGLTKNPMMVEALKNGPYKDKALIPSTPWIKNPSLNQPKLTLNHHDHIIEANWNISQTNYLGQWIVYAKYDEEWEIHLFDKHMYQANFSKIKNGKELKIIAVKAIDRLGNISPYFAKAV